jgi:SAM-dependent methyltransferase
MQLALQSLMPGVNAAREFQSPQIRLERVACPRCGGAKSSPVYAAQDYLYGLPGTFYAESCDDCALWFQNPRPVEADIALLYPDCYGPHSEPPPRSIKFARNEDWLRKNWRAWNRGYLTKLGYNVVRTRSSAERFSEALGGEISRAARRRAGTDLVPRFVPEGRLLELGCGTGQTLHKLRDLGWRNLYGVEISDSAARVARRSGFTIQTAPIETALDTYPDGWFDAIVAEMVLEHLVNPFAVVQRIARKLKPGGEFVFSTVIRDSLDGRIFGRYGVCYDFPRHMVFFRKHDLNELLRRDFDPIQSCHQNTPIDFQRPAYLRSGRFDGELQRFFKTRAGARVVELLARLKLMGRVSYRCRRKP